jgi:GNAT superfamily N-acetyltransferase
VQCAIGLFAEDAGTRDKTIDAEWPGKHATQRFNETISDPARLVLVARHTAEVAGSLSAALEPATAMRPIRTVTLTSIYVHPRYRSSGVGTQLVEQLRAWAQEMNATRASK